MALIRQLYLDLSEIGRTHEHDLIRAKMRELREKTGISQRDLSKMLGRNYTYVFNLESGEIRRIDVVELSEYLKAIGTSLPEFLKLISEHS